jgi:hypothetical protein
LREGGKAAEAFAQRRKEMFLERFTLESSVRRKIELYREVLSLRPEKRD